MWRGGLGRACPFPTLSVVGALIASPCSVSTSRSSNRTCGFPASGFRTRTHAFACNVSCSFRTLVELVGSRQSHSSLSTSYVDLELRPLCSTSITWRHHYYGPLRHLVRPSLLLTEFSLWSRPTPQRLPVLLTDLLSCMPSPLPRWNP